MLKCFVTHLALMSHTMDVIEAYRGLDRVNFLHHVMYFAFAFACLHGHVIMLDVSLCERESAAQQCMSRI